MDVQKMLDALVRRHRELAVEAGVITRALAASGVEERLQGVFGAFIDAMRFHVQREERFLFPAIRALFAGEDEGVASLLGTMSTIELEHEELLELEQRLAALAESAGDVGQQVVRFLAAWELHHDTEDLELFGRVKDRLERRAVRAGVRL